MKRRADRCLLEAPPPDQQALNRTETGERTHAGHTDCSSLDLTTRRHAGERDRAPPAADRVQLRAALRRERSHRVDAGQLEQVFCVQRFVRHPGVRRAALHEAPPQNEPTTTTRAVVTQPGSLQYHWCDPDRQLHVPHPEQQRLQAVHLRPELLQRTHQQVLGVRLRPEQSSRARRHGLRRAEEAEAALPALVPPHHCSALLLVLLQRHGGRRRLVHDHELRRPRTHVQLLRCACRRPARAAALRGAHHQRSDRADGHGAGGERSGVPLDAARRLSVPPRQHHLGRAHVPQLPAALLQLLLPDVPAPPRRRQDHQVGVEAV